MSNRTNRRLNYLQRKENKVDKYGKPRITWDEYRELLALRGESPYFSDTDSDSDDDMGGYKTTTTTTGGGTMAPPSERAEIMESIYWRNIAEGLDEQDAYNEGFSKMYNVKMSALLNLRKQVGGRVVNVSMPQVTLEDYIADQKVLDCYLYIERWKLRKKLGMAPPSEWGVSEKYNRN